MSDGYRESAEFLDIVDIGAGSGLGTLAIAKALPQAEILAVEPSPGPRAVLLPRVHGDPDLTSGAAGPVRRRRRDRHDRSPESARPPRAVGCAGAPAIVNLQPPEVAVAVPDSRFREIPIGRRVYEGWGRAEPVGVSPAGLRAETAEHGPAVRGVGAGVFAISTESEGKPCT